MAHMQSTRPSDLHYHYLGIDLTDRYATTPRAIDVCGLEVTDNGLIAHFWTWVWPAVSGLDVSTLSAEIGDARRTLIDGPQGLAARGNRMRASEKELGAPGKTPDMVPDASNPFGGYIRSSVEFFAELDNAFGREWLESGRLGEVYPGAIWKQLAPALPKKATVEGRAARTALLRALDVRLPVPLPTHDQLDACVSALVAAAADGEIDGMNTVAVGAPVFRDGGLREGQMLVPLLSPHKHAQLTRVLPPRRRPEAAGRMPGVRAFRREIGTRNAETLPQRTAEDVDRRKRAAALFRLLIDEFVGGRPTVCTYTTAIEMILGHPKLTPGYLGQLLSLARQMASAKLPGLDDVLLDTFLVSGKSGRPGRGFWRQAPFGEARWDEHLGNARVLSRETDSRCATAAARGLVALGRPWE